jgi:TatA/E family protein of Tat protein translocase
MLSLPHLIIIFLVALMVFGPEKLPDLARNLGKIIGEFKRAAGELHAGFEDQMRDLERDANLSAARKRQYVTENRVLPAPGNIASGSSQPKDSKNPGSSPTFLTDHASEAGASPTTATPSPGHSSSEANPSSSHDSTELPSEEPNHGDAQPA